GGRARRRDAGTGHSRAERSRDSRHPGSSGEIRRPARQLRSLAAAAGRASDLHGLADHAPARRRLARRDAHPFNARRRHESVDLWRAAAGPRQLRRTDQADVSSLPRQARTRSAAAPLGYDVVSTAPAGKRADELVLSGSRWSPATTDIATNGS